VRAELSLGAVGAVEEELGRLVEVVAAVVGAPALLVVREPPTVAFRAAEDEGEPEQTMRT